MRPDRNAGFQYRKPKDGVEKPKGILDVPRYIAQLVGGFFKRLFYIVKLVWGASAWMLIAMTALCLINGFLPVIGAYISKDLLNSVASLIGAAAGGSMAENIFTTLRPLIFLLVLYFIYTFLNKLFSRINSMVTGIAGELVVNHIKMKIIKKADEVDIRSFDSPAFYEKLENANREAGMRPIQILSATFSVISACISAVSFVAVLASLSPYAPFIIIASAIPGAIVNYVYRNRNFRYIRHHSKERRAMNYYSGLMVNKDMAKEIRILGLGGTFRDKYSVEFKKYYKGLKRLIIKEGTSQMIIGLLSTVINCLLFLFVAYNVVFENGEIGDYSLYTGALTSISTYVTTILTSTATIYEGTLFINNMMEFVAEEATVIPTRSPALIPEKGKPHTIEFKNVSFSYPGSKRKVINNVDLVLEPKDNVVLVGLNGAGKTTLIKLLTRSEEHTSELQSRI